MDSVNFQVGHGADHLRAQLLGKDKMHKALKTDPLLHDLNA
jgi:hypothetical protein